MKRLEEGDGLDAAAFLEKHPPAHLSIRVTYRCRGCGNTVETGIRVDVVSCVRCGSRMRPTT